MQFKRITLFISLLLFCLFFSACSRVSPGSLDDNFQASRYPLKEAPPGYYRLSGEERARLSPYIDSGNEAISSNSSSKDDLGAHDSYIKSSKDRIAGIIKGEVEPPSPEEYQAEMKELGKRWFFGPGFGSACLNIFLAVSYPPYAFYILGNAGLELSGIGAVYPTDLFPEKPAKALSKGYSHVVSVPGRVNAFIFNEDYRDPFNANDTVSLNTVHNNNSLNLLNSANNSF